MGGASRKSRRKNCETAPSVTSSVESQAGRSPCDLQEFQQTFLFSQEASPVSPTPSPASKKVWKTSEISGPSSLISSRSASLQLSLENKLKELLPTDGSIECNLTWNRKVTPSGMPYCLLRASARRTSDTESSGGLFTYPTPKQDDGSKSIRSEQGVINEYKRKGVNDLNTAVGLAVYPTPNAQEFGCKDVQRLLERKRECKERTGNGNGFGMTLGQFLQVELAPYMTPRAKGDAGGNRAEQGDIRNLEDQVKTVMEMCAPRGTPTTRDYKDSGEAFEKNPDIVPIDGRLSRQVMPGATIQSNTTATENTGVLDAAFSRWLMGYPAAWDRYSPGWSEWQTWQTFLRNLSSTPNGTESAD